MILIGTKGRKVVRETYMRYGHSSRSFNMLQSRQVLRIAKAPVGAREWAKRYLQSFVTRETKWNVVGGLTA